MIQATLKTLAVLTQLPPSVIAIGAGTLASWGFTQRVKFWVPASWSPKARELAAQTTAFLTGFGVTGAIYPGALTGALIAGLIVGLWSPALWNIAMFLIGLKWPELRARLSQDAR